MVNGRIVKLGETQYTVPPLNLRVYFACKDAAKAEGRTFAIEIVTNPKAHSAAEYVDAVVELAVPTIQRNYPDVKREELLDAIGYPDCPKLVLAMLTDAGFAKDPLDLPAKPVAGADVP